MEIKQEAIAIYGYSHHADEDGRPSRNDRRYHEKSLTLYNDRSFKLIEQNGRLDPKYESKTGTWKIEGEKLFLSIKERHFTDYSGQQKNEAYNTSKSFTKVMNHSLSDGENNWRYQQGLRPDELFKE